MTKIQMIFINIKLLKYPNISIFLVQISNWFALKRRQRAKIPNVAIACEENIFFRK